MTCFGPGDPINSFALVTYIPPPLGQYLDELRRELVPGCQPRAHVTILPPRPLVSAREAWDYMSGQIRDVAPFRIEADGVAVFKETSVIYLSLTAGHGELERIHEDLNAGPVGSQEQFKYHPHITLAQELLPAEFDRVLELARRRWAEYRDGRSFAVESVTFVQNTSANRWIDLEHMQLGAVSVP